MQIWKDSCQGDICVIDTVKLVEITDEYEIFPQETVIFNLVEPLPIVSPIDLRLARADYEGLNNISPSSQ